MLFWLVRTIAQTAERASLLPLSHTRSRARFRCGGAVDALSSPARVASAERAALRRGVSACPAKGSTRGMGQNTKWSPGVGCEARRSRRSTRGCAHRRSCAKTSRGKEESVREGDCRRHTDEWSPPHREHGAVTGAVANNMRPCEQTGRPLLLRGGLDSVGRRDQPRELLSFVSPFFYLLRVGRGRV